jgi:hypothetical protein
MRVENLETPQLDLNVSTTPHGTGRDAIVLDFFARAYDNRRSWRHGSSVYQPGI